MMLGMHHLASIINNLTETQGIELQKSFLTSSSNQQQYQQAIEHPYACLHIIAKTKEG